MDPTLPSPPLYPVEVELAALPAGGSERYTKLSLLGEGGMGSVWNARDDRVGREVALKELKPTIGDDAETRARFLREARVQGQLEHPSIAPVYDLGLEADGRPFLVMRRLRGDSLHQVINGLRRKDPQFLKRYGLRKLLSAFGQVCLAVHFAHERGVVHRDLKPANIILGDYGEVFVIDWGLARLMGQSDPELGDKAINVPADLHSQTRAGLVMGTPGYMPPEQVRGALDELDARTDVYALGSILFEVLTLRYLHDRSNVDQILVSTLQGADARCNVRAPERNVAPELERLCVAATLSSRQDRIRSARELQEGIERYLEGDRDLELRRTMAARHAAHAKRLLGEIEEGVDGQRPAAMQEIGRALALDPTRLDVVETMVKLTTTPPKELPTEVRATIAAREGERYRQTAAGGAIGFGSGLLLIPLFLEMGVESWFGLGLMLIGLAIATLVATVSALRKKSSWVNEVITSIAGAFACSSIAVICGPLFLMPTVMLVHVYALALSPYRGLRKAHVGFGIFAVLLWTGLEWGGVVSPSYAFVEGTLQILPGALRFPETPTRVLLSISSLLCLGVPLILGGRLREQFSATERQAELLLWHLGRMVPSADDEAEAKVTLPSA